MGAPAWAHLVRQLEASVCLDVETREERNHLHFSSRWGGKSSRRFGIYETLKKWIGCTTLLIQYVSWRWAVNPAVTLTWWSAAAGSGVDEWCSSILFLGTIYSAAATVVAEANCFLLESGSILLLSGGWVMSRRTLFDTIIHTEALRNKGGGTDGTVLLHIIRCKCSYQGCQMSRSSLFISALWRNSELKVAQ